MVFSWGVHPANRDSPARGELEYHEQLYSGFAQQHFAKAAVRAFRAHLVRRILERTGAGPDSRVLSLGCGIGDTEILLAPRVGSVAGLDCSPAAVRQAREDAARAGLRNVVFQEGSLEDGFPDSAFDVVVAVFFLHHLPDAALAEAPRRIVDLLAPGGRFYSLDPSRYRLSGAVGSLLSPQLMKKYQSPGERELEPQRVKRLFDSCGFPCELSYYDFGSTPLAGLAPSWAAGYKAARLVDDVMVRLPLVRRLSSNFEILASKRGAA
jgi:SAM-dependent methyltransferase